jgi:heptosyltransferase-2
VSGLGDAVMVRSIIEHLRRHNPELEIGVLTCPPTREALSCASNFAVHCYDPKRDNLLGLFRILREVRSAGYDAAVDFEPYTVLTPIFLRLAGLPVRVGFSNSVEPSRTRFLSHTLPLNPKLSVWQNFVVLARSIDPLLSLALMTLPLPVTEKEADWTEAWLRDHVHNNAPLVALHIGGSARTAFKSWPVEQFVALARRLRELVAGLTIVLTGAAADRILIDQFQTAFDGRVLDGSVLGSLQRTAILLRRCDLLVSNDTGIMHLGASMGTPTVGLFGANRPEHWAPVGMRATYVREAKVHCSPCMNVYERITPADCFNRQYSQCMWEISVDAVIAAGRKVINGDWLDTPAEISVEPPGDPAGRMGSKSQTGTEPG